MTNENVYLPNRKSLSPEIPVNLQAQRSTSSHHNGPMKIKKFVGASMNECLLQVKKELGDNAVILDSRKVSRGGPFSFLLNDMVEVTASTPDHNPPPLRRTRNWTEIAKTAPEIPGNITSDEFDQLSEEIRGLRDTVLQMADHLKYDQLPSLPKELDGLHRRLLDNGVESAVASTVTQEIALQLSGDAFEDRKLLVRTLREKTSKIVRATSVVPQGTRPWVIALIGPTGVGKTTTLAKMATHPDIFGKKRVALISADTYRIAAVEQLKTFASIAGIPLEAVYRPADIRHAISRLSDRDVILIDTAGRSQNHPGQLRDLTAFMEFAEPDEIHLVLSVSTRLEDQLDVINKFRVAGPRRLLFTKLDETTSYGMILNVCFHERKPVSLLTCGQNVPDDILAPNQMQLVRLVTEKSFFSNVLLKDVTARLASV